MGKSAKKTVAIVTGGSKGYGAGIAEVLKESGVEVWITGRDQAARDATASRLGVQAMAADVAEPAAWDRLFEKVLSSAGRLDILVNNAGGGIRIGPMAEQTDDAIARSIAVNLTGVLFGCRRAAKVMRAQQSGIIINISSGCAIHAWPGWGPYSAAKAGLNQFGHCRAAGRGGAGHHHHAVLGRHRICYCGRHCGSSGRRPGSAPKDHAAARDGRAGLGGLPNPGAPGAAGYHGAAAPPADRTHVER